MPRAYKAKNKRVISRASGGQFRKTSLTDIGIDPREIQDDFAICAGCGYGADEGERWRPILRTGFCPRCTSQEKDEATKARQIEAIVGREWESLGQEGQALLARLRELTKGAFINPVDMSEIQSLQSRLSFDFGVNYLKRTVQGWR